MKLTDLTMVYIVILLPIVITVMVNTSIIVSSQKHELYTKTVIDSSVRDAVDSMKQVENEDSKGEYGYSNDIIGRISVDPNVAVTTFFDSMALNLGAVTDEYTSEELRLYVPAIAVMDYDGMYIYSVDNTDGIDLDYSVKPKVYFSFSYCIVEVREVDINNGIRNEYDTIKYVEYEYAIVPYDVAMQRGYKIYGNLVYNVKYTQDNYIYLDVYQIGTNGLIPLKEAISETADLSMYNSEFYVDDYANNTWLVGERLYLYWLDGGARGYSKILPEELLDLLREQAVKLIIENKAQIIANTCQNQIIGAVANHNKVCSNLGINYQFKYESDMSETWYEKNKGVGIIVMVQGLKTGRSYIDYTLNNISTVGISRKYLLSEAITALNSVAGYTEEQKKLILNYTKTAMYYHADEACPLYTAYKEYDKDAVTLAPAYFYTEAECVANGFVSCPVCKP